MFTKDPETIAEKLAQYEAETAEPDDRSAIQAQFGW